MKELFYIKLFSTKTFINEFVYIKNDLNKEINFYKPISIILQIDKYYGVLLNQNRKSFLIVNCIILV